REAAPLEDVLACLLLRPLGRIIQSQAPWCGVFGIRGEFEQVALPGEGEGRGGPDKAVPEGAGVRGDQGNTTGSTRLEVDEAVALGQVEELRPPRLDPGSDVEGGGGTLPGYRRAGRCRYAQGLLTMRTVDLFAGAI